MADVPAILAPQVNPNSKPALRDSLDTRARRVDDAKYYIAELHQPDPGRVFRAFVPESFTLAIQNHWEPIFGAAEGASATGIGRIGQALGVPVSLKYLTRRVWVGSEPIDFNFTFMLDTYSSTFDDVEKPIKELARMATPKRVGAFLFAPGPSMLSDRHRIYLRIGKFIVVDSVIIHNVDVTFYSVADMEDGRYMSADISVHLSTNYTPDQDDIMRFFENGQSNNNELAEANKTIAPSWATEQLEKFEKDATSGGSGIGVYNNFFPDNLIFNQPEVAK